MDKIALIGNHRDKGHTGLSVSFLFIMGTAGVMAPQGRQERFRRIRVDALRCGGMGIESKIGKAEGNKN